MFGVWRDMEYGPAFSMEIHDVVLLLAFWRDGFTIDPSCTGMFSHCLLSLCSCAFVYIGGCI